jgi:hypothetical protein
MMEHKLDGTEAAGSQGHHLQKGLVLVVQS